MTIIALFCRGNVKPKGMVLQNSLRSPPSGIGMNKKKVQNADNSRYVVTSFAVLHCYILGSWDWR